MNGQVYRQVNQFYAADYDLLINQVFTSTLSTKNN